MTWQKLNISVQQGSDDVTVHSGELANVWAGYSLILNGLHHEITSIDQSIITLDTAWSGESLIEHTASVMPTVTPLTDMLSNAITGVKENGEFSAQLLGQLAKLYTTQGDVTLTDASGAEHGLVGYPKLLGDQQAFQEQLYSHLPIIRLSQNQYGHLDGNKMAGWAHNSGFDIDINHYRVITSGIEWANREAEEQEILTAMNMAGKQHFQPNIVVNKLKWNRVSSTASSWLLFPQKTITSASLTIGCYAKLLSGELKESWLKDVNTEWGLCGAYASGYPGKYFHAHPYASTDTGEVLFIWPAVVQGHVPLDRANPKWGFYPSLYQANSYDTSVDT